MRTAGCVGIDPGPWSLGELLRMLDGRQDFARLQAAAVWGVGSEGAQTKAGEGKQTKLYGAEASAALRDLWAR